MSKVSPRCLLPDDPGPCKGSIPRYYFNKKKGQCQQFIYGGCQGNANNFKKLKACKIGCEGMYKL